MEANVYNSRGGRDDWAYLKVCDARYQLCSQRVSATEFLHLEAHAPAPDRAFLKVDALQLVSVFYSTCLD